MHACLVRKDSRLLSSELCVCLCVLCPKYLWRKTQPDPKPVDVDIDTSEFWDIRSQRCPACLIQSWKLFPLGKCLGRGSVALHAFAAETCCFWKEKSVRQSWWSWCCNGTAEAAGLCQLQLHPPHAAPSTRPQAPETSWIAAKSPHATLL